MIAIDLSKQQALGVDPKAIQQVNFTASFDWDGNKTEFIIIVKAKETILDFSQRTVKVFWMSSYYLATACSIFLFCFNIISI